MTLDVALHTNEGLFAGMEDSFFDSDAPPNRRFEIADDLWVEKLNDELVKIIFESCDPPGLFPRDPKQQFDQLYTFVREVPPEDTTYVWDGDGRLQTCVVLSRLVRPTSVAFRYSARIISHQEVVPGPVRGSSAHAFVTPGYRHDWLSQSDLATLRILLRQYSPARLPERVQRALWYHEYAAWTYYSTVRWTLVCTALEALVHTDRLGSTQQFRTRVPQLARSVGILNFSEQDAGAAYDLRSRLAHGQGLRSLAPTDLTLYEQLETILRSAVKLSIEDANFAEAFAKEDNIRGRWPIKLAQPQRRKKLR